MRRWFVVAILSLCAGVAAAGPAIKTEMKRVVEPASNSIFAVGGDVDPANGPDAAKVPDARWAEALSAARQLNATAARLTSRAYAKKGAVWKKSAADFTRLSQAAEKAAAARDGAALSKAGNDLADVCTACHTKYKPKTAG